MKTTARIVLNAAEALILQKADDWDGSQFSCIHLERAARRAGWSPPDAYALSKLYWEGVFGGTNADGDGETVEDRLELYPLNTLDERAFEVRLLMLAFFHTLAESGDLEAFKP